MARYEHLPLYKLHDLNQRKTTMFTNLKTLLMSFAVAAQTLNPAFAAPADVPETGQTTCSNAAGTTIACAGTGQDGELLAGVAVPIPRFVVGSGAQAQCVTDRLTGLMWVQAPDAPLTRIWVDALAQAEALTLCGFSDWRLPNINELESLVNRGVSTTQATALNAAGFSGVQTADPYWSSTSVAGNPVSAWFVDMRDGDVSALDKGNAFFVWPVRAGQ